MNEKPILFSTEMVQAILEGRKTQTRRIIKHGFDKEPKHGCLCLDLKMRCSVACLWENDTNDPTAMSFQENGGAVIKCPYAVWCGDKFKVDQMLWVRETHMYIGRAEQEYIFKAGYPDNVHPDLENIPSIDCIDWKPSIHMPKEAARLWLRITSVRIKRLHEISEEDAVKEGVEEFHPAPFVIRWKNYMSKNDFVDSPVESFMTLWQSINGQESWQANPWVWVIDFEVASKTGRP